MTFLNSLIAEYIKTKRSAALWVCLVVGGFVPIVMLIEALVNGGSINNEDSSWESVFGLSWIVMANFLLPMGVIIATSLIIQIENKNNGWKQLLASPQSFLTIYFSKLTVIFVMTIQFILFFVLMTIGSCLLAALINDGKLPDTAFPYERIVETSGEYLLACLPIIALQYGLSLKFKNFILSMGIGLLGVIGSAIGLSWDFIQYVPYSYPILTARNGFPETLYLYEVVSFTVLVILGFLAFRQKKDFS